MTPKQAETLNQLKDNCKDIARPEWDDYYWTRWLRAREYDLKKAEKMLRTDVEWRKTWNADKMLEWEPTEVLRKYYPGGYFGEDKNGLPVYIDCLGTVDLKGMFFSTTKKDILKYKIYYVEYLYNKLLPIQCKKHGRRIEGSSMIFDMEGLGLKHLWKPAVDVFTETLSILEQHYPETLGTCYVINAPKFFPIMWNVAKPFLHEETRRKIKVLGKNYKEQLNEFIDPDQRPVYWGGTCRDPDGDEYCRSKVCVGGKVPEKYRLKNIRENIDMTNFENCTVQRGSTVQLDYEVSEPGSTLRYQFLSEGNDIGFGIFRRTSDERQKKGDMVEIVKSQRVESHLIPEEGNILLEEAGKYVVRFDNTYSWVNAKKVAYLIDILPPDQENELQITEL